MPARAIKKRSTAAGTPCHYCLRPMLPTRTVRAGSSAADKEAAMLSATLDHLETQSRDGGHESSNLTVACQRCNNIRSDTPYEIFFEFALVVLRAYPDAPYGALKQTLNRFIIDLAVLGMTKNNLVRTLSVLAKTRLEEELGGRPMGWKSRPSKDLRKRG